MAKHWSDRFSLCLKAAVLSVCSLLKKMFLPCRLIIDPAGSVGPRGTGCDSDWKLVLLQPGLDTQLGGTPSVCSCIFPCASYVCYVAGFLLSAGYHAAENQFE